MRSIKHALQLIGENTRNIYDVWQLAGDAKSTIRQQVMTALTGIKHPKAKCGVNAIMQTLRNEHGINGHDRDEVSKAAENHGLPIFSSMMRTK